MRKILGVVGSPRINGNTHHLVAKILTGAREAGAITELILLTELNIKECDGCHVCWKSGKCSKKDDMDRIYFKIRECDLLIFGTPVYWYGPTALMKGFIDRLVFFNCGENKKGISGKQALIVIPFEENDYQTAAPVVAFFEKSLAYLEVELINQIIVPGVSRQGEVLKNFEIMEKVYKLGRDLASIKTGLLP